MLPSKRPPTHPGEMLLEEYIKPLGISQVYLSEQLGIPVQRLNTLIKGKRGITPDTALRLATYFDTSPEVWMQLQSQHDLWHAQQGMKTQLDAIRRAARRAALASAR
jgi:antitoxin HigA-1